MTALLSTDNVVGLVTPNQPTYCVTGILTLPMHMKVPTANKLRQILALLITRSGEPVPFNLMVEEVWGDDVPKPRSTTAHTYVSQIRRHLGAGQLTAGKELLRTTNCGYMLDLPRWEVDALQFMGTVEELTAEPSEPQLRHMLAQLEVAFARVSKYPLLDVKHGPVLQRWITCYDEAYRTGQRLKFEIALRLGLHLQVLPELLATWRENPTWEDFAKLLILALYRSNRRAEIPAVCNETRRQLVTELGLDFSPQFRWLHQRILQGDETLLRNCAVLD